METEKRGVGRPKGGKNNVLREGTTEVAKNFEYEVSIHCTVCNKVYKLSECLKEEPMPAPHETVTEGFLLCPGCGDRKHSYYLSERVRYQQTRLSVALKRYHETQDKRDWRTYKKLHDSFQILFDSCQKHYGAVFEKETVGESRGE